MSFGLPPTTPSHPYLKPFFGVVDNTIHAFQLVLAAQRGIVPRIAQRLKQAELREMITSGAVFIFSVEESGMKRWRDGLFWTPSRIDGNFLVYKETNQVGEGRPNREEWLASTSHDPNGGLKIGGLHKRTITVKVDRREYHVISYYRPEDIHSGKLKPLSSRADIMALMVPAHLFRDADYRVPPNLEMGEGSSAYEPELSLQIGLDAHAETEYASTEVSQSPESPSHATYLYPDSVHMSPPVHGVIYPSPSSMPSYHRQARPFEPPHGTFYEHPQPVHSAALQDVQQWNYSLPRSAYIEPIPMQYPYPGRYDLPSEDWDNVYASSQHPRGQVVGSPGPSIPSASSYGSHSGGEFQNTAYEFRGSSSTLSSALHAPVNTERYNQMSNSHLPFSNIRTPAAQSEYLDFHSYTFTERGANSRAYDRPEEVEEGSPGHS